MFKNFHKNKYNSKSTRLSYSRGVTLIELLVVIIIFMIITGITIFSYGKFDSSMSIQNLADDMALSVRRAQSYAIGVRGISGSSSSFEEGYGVHFTADPSLPIDAGSNKSFILFADLNTSQQTYKYNHPDDISSCGDSTTGIPTVENECMEVLSIMSADQITAIYLNDDTEAKPPTGTVDIIFKRPNPEPYFCYRENDSQSSCNLEGSDISYIRIKISNITNPEIYKIVTISNNGQISVSNDEKSN